MIIFVIIMLIIIKIIFIITHLLTLEDVKVHGVVVRLCGDDAGLVGVPDHLHQGC